MASSLQSSPWTSGKAATPAETSTAPSLLDNATCPPLRTPLTSASDEENESEVEEIVGAEPQPLEGRDAWGQLKTASRTWRLSWCNIVAVIGSSETVANDVILQGANIYPRHGEIALTVDARAARSFPTKIQISASVSGARIKISDTPVGSDKPRNERIVFYNNPVQLDLPLVPTQWFLSLHSDGEGSQEEMQFWFIPPNYPEYAFVTKLSLGGMNAGIFVVQEFLDALGATHAVVRRGEGVEDEKQVMKVQTERRQLLRSAQEIRVMEALKTLADQAWEEPGSYLPARITRSNLAIGEETLPPPSHILLFTSWGSGGALLSYIEDPALNMKIRHPSISRRLFGGLLSGLEFMHAHQIVHRDVKPENLVLDSPYISTANIKLIDYGISRMGSTEVADREGTHAYMTAEALDGKVRDARFDDRYAAGVVWMEVMAGRVRRRSALDGVAANMPIARTPKEVHRISDRFMPRAKVLPPLFEDLVNSLVDVKAKRIHFPAEGILSHPFFTTPIDVPPPTDDGCVQEDMVAPEFAPTEIASDAENEEAPEDQAQEEQVQEESEELGALQQAPAMPVFEPRDPALDPNLLPAPTERPSAGAPIPADAEEPLDNEPSGSTRRKRETEEPRTPSKRAEGFEAPGPSGGRKHEKRAVSVSPKKRRGPSGSNSIGALFEQMKYELVMSR